MATFGPLFTGAGGWSFDDPIPATTTSATTLYSQDLPNHPNFYFNSTSHQGYNINNYFPHGDYFTSSDARPNIIPPAPYNPTILPPAIAGGGELSPAAGFSIMNCEGKAGPGGGDETMAAEKKRKMYHNASERDRRKKINSLYSSLRAVLPATDRMKRLSNPDTVARAVKYIPELQKKVQLLAQKKEELLPTANTDTIASSQPSPSTATSSYSVQATDLGNGEILLHVSTLKSVTIIPLSEIMREVEEEVGLLVVDVSSSESSAGRISHHLLLKVEATLEIKCESLKKKVLSSCMNWEIKLD